MEGHTISISDISLGTSDLVIYRYMVVIHAWGLVDLVSSTEPHYCFIEFSLKSQ